MATPQVSGFASLLKGFNGNLANDDIENIIRLSADRVGADPYINGRNDVMGFGRINAGRALQFLRAPFTLVQTTARGGTVANTSSRYIMTILGANGLASGNYSVARYEIRTTITLPNTICNVTGIWGRGVSSVGWSLANPNFGEGFCELVPGTLTNTQATLRTYIYDIYTINGQHVGFYPTTAANVVFAYSVLGTAMPVIAGTSPMCTSPYTYTVTGLQAGASVSGWTATPSGYVSLAPNGNSVKVTKIFDGDINLTATLANSGCRTNTVTRPITVGNPFPTGITTAISDYVSYNGPLQSGFTFFLPKGKGGTAIYNVSDTRYSSLTWAPVSVQSGTSWSASGRQLNETVTAPQTQYSQASVTVRLTAQGPCGSYTQDFSTTAVANSSFDFTVSPNPAQNLITLSTINNNQKNNSGNIIYAVKITDRFGIVRKFLEYKQGITTEKISLSDLNSGTYLVSIFDGYKWTSKALVIQK